MEGTHLEVIIIILVSILILMNFIVIMYNNGLLKRIGRWLRDYFSQNRAQNIINAISNISEAAIELSDNKKGSIIAIQTKDELTNLFMNAQELNADINANLIINIFGGEESQPLHDGAIVISNNKIHMANAFVKKLTTSKIDKKYGARHRAAIGLSEQSDAVVIITSEERKGISLAYGGKVSVIADEEIFDVLSEYLLKNIR